MNTLLKSHFFPKEKAVFTIGRHASSLGTTYLIQTNNNKKHPSESDSATIMEGNIFSWNYKSQSWGNSLFLMPPNSTKKYFYYIWSWFKSHTNNEKQHLLESQTIMIMCFVTSC